ncbi:MAG: hypothetical protein NTAFB01_40000 [Nitrospira sp.]
MGMSFINWVGFVMLLLTLLLNEAFLGINAWYELHLGAILAGVTWLVVAAALSMWPNRHDQSA